MAQREEIWSLNLELHDKNIELEKTLDELKNAMDAARTALTIQKETKHIFDKRNLIS